MYRIATKGYNNKEKCIIANKYLVPKIRKMLILKDQIIIPDDTIEHM